MLYSDLIESALSEAARKALQMFPEGYHYEPKSPFAREQFQKGVDQGLELGQAKAKAQCILDVIEERGLCVSPEQRETILNCADLEQLTRWHRRAIHVTAVDELFAQ